MCSIHSISHKSVFRIFFSLFKGPNKFCNITQAPYKFGTLDFDFDPFSGNAPFFRWKKSVKIFPPFWKLDGSQINYLSIWKSNSMSKSSRSRESEHSYCWVKTLTVIHPSQQQQLRIYAISIIAYGNFCVEYFLSIYSAVRKFLQMFFFLFFHFLFSMSFVFELILICHCCCGSGKFFN